MRTIRNWTTGETSVVSASSRRGTKLVMIATKAITSGTSARKEAKTKLKTSKAPKAPINPSTSTPLCQRAAVRGPAAGAAGQGGGAPGGGAGRLWARGARRPRGGGGGGGGGRARGWGPGLGKGTCGRG